MGKAAKEKQGGTVTNVAVNVKKMLFLLKKLCYTTISLGNKRSVR